MNWLNPVHTHALQLASHWVGSVSVGIARANLSTASDLAKLARSVAQLV